MSPNHQNCFPSPETHHAFNVLDSSDGGALRSVAIAEAVAADDQLIHGVVVLLFDLHSRVEQVVTQSVQVSEVHTQVCDLQLICKEQKDMKTTYGVSSDVFFWPDISHEVFLLVQPTD